MKKNNLAQFALFSVFLLMLGLGGCVSTPEREEPKGPFFYPPKPDPPRIQYLTSISGGDDFVRTKKSEFAKFILGEQQEGDTVLTKPYGVALSNGNLFAVDTRGGGYAVFDLKEKTFRTVGGAKKPINITIDTDGHRYITDTLLSQVIVFDRNDYKVQVFGEAGEFKYKPVDVAILGNKLYISDMANNQIQVLDKASGEFLYSIGSSGPDEGQLFQPTNLAIGPDENLYVSDTGNFRVQVFSPEGRFIRQLGELGKSLGQFARPKGIAVDRDGNIFVVDAAFQNVQIFNSQGEFLMFFAGTGTGPGQLYLPTDIAIDYDNVEFFQSYAAPGFKIEYIILVSNQFGKNKINAYGFGKMEGLDYQ